MNRDDIIRMAREAGISTQYDSDNGKDWTANVWGGAMQTRVMERFANLIEQEVIQRIKDKKNPAYTDIVSDGGMDPRN